MFETRREFLGHFSMFIQLIASDQKIGTGSVKLVETHRISKYVSWKVIFTGEVGTPMLWL